MLRVMNCQRERHLPRRSRFSFRLWLQVVHIFFITFPLTSCLHVETAPSTHLLFAVAESGSAAHFRRCGVSIRLRSHARTGDIKSQQKDKTVRWLIFPAVKITR